MDKTKLFNDLESTTSELLGVLSEFSYERFNRLPFEGSWTAGQVADHLFQAEQGAPALMTGTTTQTTRSPEQFVKPLDDIFLDFSTKLKSPNFILPTSGPHDQNEYYRLFEANRKNIQDLAATLDLTQTCNDFEMPGIGHLTRFELLRFIVAHSTRHIRQLKNILSHVGKNEQPTAHHLNITEHTGNL
jgi:uncharacterized damage-inducible protein DinB